jgi:hypothetical protein
MGGHPTEQGPGLVGVPATGGGRRGEQGSRTEPGEPDRMLGEVDDRPHEVGGEIVVGLGGPLEGAAPPRAVRPERGGRLVHRPEQEAGPARVERVGAVDLGPQPPQPVALQAQLAEER